MNAGGIAGPVSPEEFRAALARLGAPKRAVLAVSGGPDSMALARLAAAAAPCELVAVIIDHGLRAASAGEAEKAARWCAEAGLKTRILVWEGAKPATGRQAAARAARYFLLARFAVAENCDALLTGHTADDQAETVFMRLARGAGPAGLSGMATETCIAAEAGPPVRLLRPLLDWPRERILATLDAFGQGWIDDPSNVDEDYERVRTRALLAALEEQNLLTRAALCRTARRMTQAVRRMRDDDRAAFEVAQGRLDPAGVCSFEADAAISPSLAARIIRAVSGAAHAPPEEAAEIALAEARRTGAATLGGAMLLARKGRFWAFREPAALMGRAGAPPAVPLTVPAGSAQLWDGRFAVENRGRAAIAIGPRGAAPAEGLMGPVPDPDAPSEAFLAAPTVRPPSGGENGARIVSLLEERLFGAVVRFSEG